MFSVYDVVKRLRSGVVVIYLPIEFIIKFTDKHDVVAPNYVQAHWHLLYSLLHAEYAFVAILKDNIDGLIKPCN